MNSQYRSTKIVCTIGPTSETEERLAQMVQAGMNVARLNFSHGKHADHAERILRIRRVSESLGIPVAILQDLQGPKIRVGTFLNNQWADLVPGRPFIITTADVEGSQERVSTTYKNIVNDVKPGDMLLLDDGKLRLEVTKVVGAEVHTKVVVGGTLKEKKGINLPGVRVSLPSLTDKDREDLQFGLQQGVDYVAVSFVREAADIRLVRETIQEYAPEREYVPIIAKIEKPEALENLDAILAAADGVMVARGDLGVEIGPDKVPAWQKHIIKAANMCGKIVITATQMLESMIDNPMPTRAEASDVANAIFDGTDAVMLSGESASGKYPVESVQMMTDIIHEAESSAREWGIFRQNVEKTESDQVELAKAACRLADSSHVSVIAAFTHFGGSARILAKQRPDVRIFAFTTHSVTYRQLSLLWGVYPYLITRLFSVKEMLEMIEKNLHHSNLWEAGKRVVLMAGLPIVYMGPSNMVLVHTQGEDYEKYK
jgi:pyruvate kinase